LGSFGVGCQRRLLPGPPTPENGQKLPIDSTAPLWQHRRMMVLGGTEKQFSLTRAALSACGRARNQFLIVCHFTHLLP